MTRETKVGLLVGLGFIVVFAVLLSHTDKDQAPSLAQKVADQMDTQSEVYDPEITGLADWTGPTADRASPVVQTAADEADSGQSSGSSETRDTPASPAQPRMERPQPTWMESREPQDRLANIETFDPLPSDWYRHATGNRDAEAGRHDDNLSLELVRDTGEHLTLAEGPPARIGFDDTDVARVAPRTVVRPTPTTPHAPPARSGTSEDAVADSSDDTLPIDEPARRVAPDQVASVRIESKSYVVQKGETLGEIASKVYGTVKAMSFLVDANRQTVKDKDSIIEGQTLLTPDWPGADQFEPAANPGVPSLARETPQTIVMQNLLNRTTGSAGRSAPTALVPDAPREARRTEPRVAESDPARAYTIQPKDTFCSIAKNTLGSDTLWREIQKVNPDLDPKKLRPGMTIQLPPAQAWNSVVSSE